MPGGFLKQFRKKERLSFSELVRERFDNFQWQLSEKLIGKLKEKITSIKMDEVMNELYDELQDKSDCLSLALPVEKILQESHDVFLKKT